MRLLIVRQTDDVCLVRAGGEIDLQTVAELDSALTQVQRDGNTHVVLDLWDVTFIDSVGVGVLLSASRRAEKGVGGFAVVADPHGHVHMVFDLAGLKDALPLYETRALATSTLRSVVRSADVSPFATQTMCDRCERRFAQSVVLESGRCPHCDGKVVPFGERANPNLLERPVKDGVSENGDR